MASAQSPTGGSSAEVQRHLSLARELGNKAQWEDALREAQKAEQAAESVPADTVLRSRTLVELAGYFVKNAQFADGEAAASRAVKLARKLGSQTSGDAALALEMLADVEETRGEYVAALAADRESEALRRSASPPDWQALQRVAVKVANIALALEQYDTARAALQEIDRSDAPRTIYNTYGQLLSSRLALADGRYPEAEKFVAAATAELSDESGMNAYIRYVARYHLLLVLMAEERVADAQKLADALLEEQRRKNFPLSSLEANLMFQKAFVMQQEGRYADADRLIKDAVATASRFVDVGHPFFGNVTHTYALLYELLGNKELARRAYERSDAILTASLGPRAEATSALRVQRALFEATQGDLPLAERLTLSNKKALAEAGNKYAAGVAMNNYALGLVDQRHGDIERALADVDAAIAVAEARLGENAPQLYRPLVTRAALATQAKRFAEAEATYRRLDDYARANHLSATRQAQIALGRAKLARASNDNKKAVGILRAAIAAVHADLLDRSFVLDVDVAEGRTLRELYTRFIDLELGDGASGAVAVETFEAAQYAQVSSVSRAIAVAAARVAAKPQYRDTVLSDWNTAVEQLRFLNRAVESSLSGARSRASDAAYLANVGREMARLTQRVATLDGDIDQRYPDIAKLLHPRPMAIAELQAALREEEALLLTLAGGERSYAWCVTRHDAKAIVAPLTAGDIDRLARSLRKSVQIDASGAFPIFDTAAAYALYAAFFQPCEAILAGAKHLIFIADGALQSLPPAVLIRRPAPAGSNDIDYRTLDWLGRAFAISVDPSVSSFMALRALGKREQPPKPFVGFGDPDFSGTGKARGIAARDLYRSGLRADVASLRLLPALPETERELKAMAAALGGDHHDLYLRQAAAPATLRKVNLDQFRVVAFATHAAIAGELPGLEEPALILSPPHEADAEDDGLLRASDIAMLKLNADWVILSACNTAAPDGTLGAEGLSGLAQSFFLAGARSLLVSHWSISSDATVPLTTGAVRALAENPSLGKAEALRQTIINMIDGKFSAAYSHPGFWAPFVIVGDGGAGL